MNKQFHISVLVRTHHDEAFLRQVLTQLCNQRLEQPPEIICCDDAPSADSTKILEAFPQVKTVPPPSGPYVPGKTLNMLVRQAHGNLVVFNNGDAIPQTDDFLAQLTAPLEDPHVNATFANQWARPNAFPLVRKDYERAFGDGHIAAKWPCFFSLVAAAFRREQLLRDPFDETIQYSEDVHWVFTRHAKVTYVPNAIVEHSHNYTNQELRKRFLGEGRADRQMGKDMPTLTHTLMSILAETIRDWKWLIQNGFYKELFHAPRYRWIQKISYYRGGMTP